MVGITIYDERTGVAAIGRLLHMPETTFVGQGDEVRPYLGELYERVIGEAVGVCFKTILAERRGAGDQST